MTTGPRSKPIGRFYDLQQEVQIAEDYVLTPKIKFKAPTRAQIKVLRAARTDDEIELAILGEHSDAVFDLYDNRPHQEWKAFMDDIYAHFYGPGAADVEGKSEESSSS